MAKKTTPTEVQPLDIILLFLSLFYTQSVLTAAHHTSMWVHDGTARIVEAPAVPLLIAGLLLAAYSWYKRRSPSILVIISLTVFTIASLFWLSGLRTNFYY
jgi:hypothetical protein